MFVTLTGFVALLVFAIVAIPTCIVALAVYRAYRVARDLNSLALRKSKLSAAEAARARANARAAARAR